MGKLTRMGETARGCLTALVIVLLAAAYRPSDVLAGAYKADAAAREGVQAEAIKLTIEEAAAMEQKASSGDVHAQLVLCLAYRGEGTLPKDGQKRFKFCSLAANQGDALAQSQTALCYEQGDGVKKNRSSSLHWLRKAADQGYSDAMTLLGNAYRSGTAGGKKDPALALSWYQKAAELEHPGAMTALGNMYRDGEGTQRDLNRAFTYLKQAALLGNGDALNSLGDMYIDHSGSSPGPEWERAWTCYVDAMKRGSRDRADRLATLSAFLDEYGVIEAFADKMNFNAQEKVFGGNTALFFAARAGKLEIVKLLLEHGADPNLRNFTGDSALTAAMGKEDVVAYLLEQGADVNARDQGGNTELMKAAFQGAQDTAMFLLAHGADVNARNKAGQTPLMFTVGNPAHVEMTRLLLEKGADPKGRDQRGITPLMWAIDAAAGHREIPQLIIAQGADVNAADHQGRTALSIAAGKGDLEIVKLLLDSGARAAARPPQQSSLERARAGLQAQGTDNYRRIIELLKKAGAR